MKVVIKYKAIDGKEFEKEQDCIDYELLIETVNHIMSKLPKLPENDSCSFVNGGGYIQHNKRKLQAAKIALLELCKKYIDHKWIQQTIDDSSVHPSYVARLLGDYGINPLYDAWHRFVCIDSDLKEWGQPFYASNQSKAEQTKLN